MAFAEQTVGQFLIARYEVSEFLMQETAQDRTLLHSEALILQAAGHLLIQSATFKESEVRELAQLSVAGIAKPLQRFVKIELFTREWADTPRNARSPRIYTSTDLGAQALAFFQIPETEN